MLVGEAEVGCLLGALYPEAACALLFGGVGGDPALETWLQRLFRSLPRREWGMPEVRERAQFFPELLRTLHANTESGGVVMLENPHCALWHHSPSPRIRKSQVLLFTSCAASPIEDSIALSEETSSELSTLVLQPPTTLGGRHGSRRASRASQPSLRDPSQRSIPSPLTPRGYQSPQAAIERATQSVYMSSLAELNKKTSDQHSGLRLIRDRNETFDLMEPREL